MWELPSDANFSKGHWSDACTFFIALPLQLHAPFKPLLRSFNSILVYRKQDCIHFESKVGTNKPSELLEFGNPRMDPTLCVLRRQPVLLRSSFSNIWLRMLMATPPEIQDHETDEARLTMFEIMVVVMNVYRLRLMRFVHI